MARMDLSLRRNARGVSVFWIILAVAAAVFLLLAIVLLAGEDVSERIPEGDEEIIAGEDDEVPGTTNFGMGQTADERPVEVGDVPGEAGELNEELPETGQADDTEEAGTVGAADVDPAEEVEAEPIEPAEVRSAEETVDGELEAEAVEEEPLEEATEAEVPEESAGPEVDDADQSRPAEDIVVDPDGTLAPVDPTLSGPEGRDDEVIIE